MTDTEGYNGWSNYPTWNVNLWLSNDESLWHAANSIAAEVIDNAEGDENVVNGVWTVEQTERFRTADQLKSWVSEDLTPDLEASFTADLLGYALDQVDWVEIATALLER